MSEHPPAQPEVTRFLREHPPFDVLELAAVERVAATLEVEFYRADTTIFGEGDQPVRHLRVVRSGAVEITYHGRALDLLGEGELFGHASMLSGLPAGFEARAAEDTLCYRIDAAIASELFAAPAGLRYVARSLLERYGLADGAPEPHRDPSTQPVASLIRSAPVLCDPRTPIRQAARTMTTAAASAIVVDGGDGTLGIVTDRDLRTRVIAAGLPVDAPVSAAMSTPVYTCGADEQGGEVLLAMLDRGIRHLPVLSATGDVLGVVEDLDLVEVQTRSSFFLRQRIAAADAVEELQAVADALRHSVISMHEGLVAASNIMAVYAVVVDALTRRLLELAVAEAGEPPASFAWLALGSQARREAAPSADVDSAIVWFGERDKEEVTPYLHGLATRVVAGLEQCGFHPDPHDASASNVMFIRSVHSWQRAARSWLDDPAQEKAVLLASVMVDSRPVWGVHTGTPVSDMFKLAPEHPALLRRMALFALSDRPPTGFLRGLVVEHTGEHRGRLDLKRGGTLPIVNLARWAGLAAGVTSASTTARLRAAGASGTLPAGAAQTLEDAFELVGTLRLRHQVEQLRAGEQPDDFVDPGALSALTRSHLREAFRAVASIQKHIAAELKVRGW